MRTDATSPETDPTLAVAERQLVLLGELAEIVMVAARAFGSSAVAAAEAEKMILAEECFVPEVGRARACGARDAAESLQKVARAARLTMKLQMTVAEIVRDIRAGVVTHSQDTIPQRCRRDAGGPGRPLGPPGACPGLRVGIPPAPALATATRTGCVRRPTSERLVEFERPETLPHASVQADRSTRSAPTSAPRSTGRAGRSRLPSRTTQLSNPKSSVTRYRPSRNPPSRRDPSPRPSSARR